MKFNEKIILLRKQNNLSQEQLAEKLNVARQTVSKWELEETTPDMDKLVKMSEIFNITLDELIKDEDITEVKNEVNNTNSQKLVGMTIKIIKALGIFIIVSIILYVLLAVLGITTYNSYKINNNSKSEITSNRSLTIGKIKELSKKGNNLSWVDFEEYESKEVGSGLRILYYEMEGIYHLLIGGNSEYENPMYIRLVVDDNNSEYVDIRTGDIDKFIRETIKLESKGVS